MNLARRAALVLIRLHPPAWRRRYGGEVSALVEVTSGGWRVPADLLWSAAHEWARTSREHAVLDRLWLAAVSSFSVLILVHWAMAVIAAVGSEPSVLVNPGRLGDRLTTELGQQLRLGPNTARGFLMLSAVLPSMLTAALLAMTDMTTTYRRLLTLAAAAIAVVRLAPSADAIVAGLCATSVFVGLLIPTRAVQPAASRPRWRPVRAWLVATLSWPVAIVLIALSQGRFSLVGLRVFLDVEFVWIWLLISLILAWFGGLSAMLATPVCMWLGDRTAVRRWPLLGWCGAFLACLSPAIVTRANPPAVAALAVFSWMFASSQFERTFRPEPPDVGCQVASGSKAPSSEGDEGAFSSGPDRLGRQVAT